MSQRMIEMVLFIGALLLAVLATHAYLVSRSDEQKLQTMLASQNQIISGANTRQRERDSALASALAGIAKQKAEKQSPQDLADALAKVLALPQPIRLVPDGISPASPNPPTAIQGIRNRIFKRSKATNARTLSGLAGQEPSSGSSSIEPSSRPNSTNESALSESAQSDSSSIPLLTTLGFSSLPPPGISPTPAALRAAPCPTASKCPPGPKDADLTAADLKPLYNYVLDCSACQAQLAVAKQNAADDAAEIGALTRERDAAVTAAKGGSWLRRLRRNAVWFAAGAAISYAASRR